MRFIDEATINVRAGNGGRGSVSFRREKFVPRGGPDGGDGGKGGDVIFRAEPRMLTLYDFRHKRIYEAENGQGGQGSQCYGRKGQDLVVDVPVGTLIYALPQTVEVEGVDEGEEIAEIGSFGAGGGLLADLTRPGQQVVVAHGGRGGKGNLHFKSSTMRAPRFAQPGEPGEELRVRLELKIIADVGLLGLPNAGKSTFISTVSAAKPKVAPYPFTTLVPNLGVVQDDLGRQMVIADIPGLIEGASEGLGLGHRFLRHVERTRLLLHLLSAEEIQLDSDDPFAGYALLDDELRLYDETLAEKEQIKVVNKIDLLDDETLAAVRAAAEECGLSLRFISAKHGVGVEELMEEVWSRVRASADAEIAALAAAAEAAEEGDDEAWADDLAAAGEAAWDDAEEGDGEDAWEDEEPRRGSVHPDAQEVPGEDEEDWFEDPDAK